MPTVNIPEVGAVNFPDTMSQEDIIKAIQNDILPKARAPEPEPSKDTGIFSMTGRAIARGAKQTGSLLGDVLPAMAASAVGADEYAARQMQEAAQTQKEIEQRLDVLGAKFEVLNNEDLINTTAKMLASGKAVGWHQGRMEFGPRALGGRSILADPRSSTIQKQLNLKVKYRESFRPFAPSVLRADVSEWFDLDADSPYMLLVASVLPNKQIAMTQEEKSLFGIDKLNIPRSEIPAVTHVDYSARVQTVYQATSPKYFSLITRFKEITGCPVLVNTSFNVRGEPIVESPDDAFKCLMGTDIDLLVIGNCILEKKNQDDSLINNYLNQYALD
jgi:carbamoyltransferase